MTFKRFYVGFLITAIFFNPLNAISGAQANEEYAIKAAFLYHFGEFVEWPSNGAQFIIGIIGKDPFGHEIDMLENETLKGKKVEVRRYDSEKAIQQPHILFISPSEAARIPDIMNQLAGKPVLTVSDSEGFLREGGIIRLVRVGKKICFEINKKKADQEGLKISSQLLNLAMDVVQ